MNASILNTEIQEFIIKHLNSDVNTIILKGSPFNNVKIQDIVEQIEAKKRSEKKLPSWFQSANIYYPNKLNIEQTSSEITAKYKAQLIKGNTIIDLTGGFGIDAFYFSKQFSNVIHCEINSGLSKIVTHNYKQLNINTIDCLNINGISYLKQNNHVFDWIYIDPSRRNESKGKVFFLSDCLPNVLEHLELLFKHSNSIMIKTSPLLDLSKGVEELDFVKSIHVVAINNEVKELLWILEKGFSSNITIKTVNIKNEYRQNFSFKLSKNKQGLPKYSLPLTYIYEPNAAILKSGGFNELSIQFECYKLHKNSHLYTNNALINFPGRAFKVNYNIPYNKKAFKKLGIGKANVTTRNFSESVETIRKKLKIKDGGTIYLFFTTNLENKKIILVTTKIK